MAAVAKALGDPIRLQLVDVLRKHAGKVCVCELVPLFDISQPTLSHHLKTLRDGRHRRLRAARAVGLLLRPPRRPGGADRMAELSENTDIREIVRERYAAARQRASPTARRGCGCGPADASALVAAARDADLRTTDADGDEVFGAALYGDEAARRPDRRRSQASLGCGVPTAVADLHEGETVLDLGSGAGADVLISARRVGPTGRAIGLDMTDEMLALARAQRRRGGRRRTSSSSRATSRTSRSPTSSVDVVISNCVINLSADKPQVIREAARVLQARRPLRRLRRDRRPRHGRRPPAPTWQQWTGCIAGALTEHEFADALTAAGLTDIEIRPTHRVHAHAALGDRPRPQAIDGPWQVDGPEVSVPARVGSPSARARVVVRAQPPRTSAAARTGEPRQ